MGLDTPGFTFVTPDEAAGDRTVRLPAGQYAVESSFFTENEPYTLIAAPGVQLKGQRLMVFDERETAPVTVTAPSRKAEPFVHILDYQIVTEDSGFSSTTFLGNTSPIYYGATLKPIPPSFQSSLHSEWLDSSTTPSSFYSAAWLSHDSLVKGPVKSIPTRKTAVVKASYAASLGTTDLINDLSIAAVLPGSTGWSSAAVTGPLPLERTEYYYSEDPGVRWLNELWMHDEDYTNSMIIGWVPREYRAGRSYTSRWNRPLFSMFLAEETMLGSTASRAGDTIILTPSMYADSDHHAGYVANESHIVLFRDGAKLAESLYDSAAFDVPPEPGKYRVELDHAQSLFQLTSKQRVVWEFESQHVATGEERLPLLAISFNPALDERGQAPRVSHFCLPLSVSQFGRKEAPSVHDVSLEVSFDDGATWAGAQMEHNDKGWQASFDHPRQGDFVSLRARTHDAQGNSVEQTVIRAYGLAAQR